MYNELERNVEFGFVCMREGNLVFSWMHLTFERTNSSTICMEEREIRLEETTI